MTNDAPAPALRRRRSASLWLLVVAIGLFLLQLFPVTGVFLMFLGAGVLNAMLVHLFLIVLLLESLLGFLPRALAIVPIALYGGYYWLYFEQNRVLAVELTDMKTVNVGKALDFDPTTDELVLEDMGNWAEYYISHYKIPVLFDKVHSFRMASASQCVGVTSLRNQAKAWRQEIPDYRYKFGKDDAPCLLWREERPALRPVIVTRTDRASGYLHLLGISETSMNVVVGSQRLGSNEKVSVRPVPPVWFFLGCGLVDNPPSWSCESGVFGPEKEFRWATGDQTRKEFQIPAEILLDLPRYTDDDIKSFAGYPVNDDFVKQAQIADPLPSIEDRRAHGRSKR
jgi:hypothetical protein